MKLHRYILSALALLFSFWLPALQPADLSFHTDAKPGEAIQGKLVIVNERDVAEKVELKPVDYSFNANGEHFYEEQANLLRSSARWIELPSSQIEIPPKSTAEVLYTIHVPQNKTLKGTYWNVILIEPVDPLPVLTQPEKDQFQLKVKVRYAYHVVVNLGNGDASLKIASRNMQQQDGKRLYQLDVVNNGELFLNPKLILKTYDENGRLVATISDQEQRIYPQTSVRYTLDLSDLKPSSYTGFLLLDNGDQHIFGDRIEFQIP